MTIRTGSYISVPYTWNAPISINKLISNSITYVSETGNENGASIQEITTLTNRIVIRSNYRFYTYLSCSITGC